MFQKDFVRGLCKLFVEVQSCRSISHSSTCISHRQRCGWSMEDAPPKLHHPAPRLKVSARCSSGSATLPKYFRFFFRRIRTVLFAFREGAKLHIAHIWHRRTVPFLVFSKYAVKLCLKNYLNPFGESTTYSVQVHNFIPSFRWKRPVSFHVFGRGGHR